jgi:hypothetical protein
MNEKSNEEVYELLVDFADAIEAAAVNIKQQISQKMKTPKASEDQFLSLKWEKKQGTKLKEFEVSTKTLNSSSESFQHCFNILKRNNATINNRFHDANWQYAYWLYNDAIFRQVLSKK